jgi:tetratricopeptide (TPR) repeat protein
MAMLARKLILAASMTLPLSAQTVTDDMAAHAQRAHEAEQRNDFSTAAREYEYLARQLPHNAEVQSNLGVALYFNHQWERAITVFHRAMVLNANLLAPHLFTGLAWYQLSKPDSSVPELETAVRLNSADVLARTWLGYAYVAQARYDAATNEFQQVTRLAPDNIDAWYALGQDWLELGRERTLDLLKAAPNGGRAWQLAGEQLQLQGNRDKAREDFQHANALRPDVPEVRSALEELGGQPATSAVTNTLIDPREDALYQGAHEAEEKSRAAFEHVLSIAPDSYRAHQIMANAYVLQQQDDKAIAEYRAVLESKPDLPGIHQAIGSALLRNGKSSEALAEFQAELALQPRSASVNTLLGQTQLLLGKNDEAEKTLTNALLMDRPPADAYRLLGKLELHRNNYPGAVRNLSRYLAVERNDATAWYLLSRAYRGLGDKEQMDHALSQFAAVSKDAKARSQAQDELAHLNNQTHIDEEAGKSNP